MTPHSKTEQYQPAGYLVTALTLISRQRTDVAVTAMNSILLIHTTTAVPLVLQHRYVQCSPSGNTTRWYKEFRHEKTAPETAWLATVSIVWQ